MRKLIVAPFLKPFENRVETLFGVLFEMAEDRDVASVADLFRKVRRIINELGPEVGVLFFLGQKPEVHGDTRFAQGIVDKACVTGFIPGH